MENDKQPDFEYYDDYDECDDFCDDKHSNDKHPDDFEYYDDFDDSEIDYNSYDEYYEDRDDYEDYDDTCWS